MNTYIKRMKIKGFKSFAKQTTLLFEPGFNTIIGANGSGKSNIFDALCFVLGRMSGKGLRTEKLGNLVFNGGSEGGKPAKEAMVEIFLDNSKKQFMDSEVEEVKISRIIKNDGSSKYYFNNKVFTRTDIVTLLRRVGIDPDGYNIILQGDIQKIVNMSNNERRELIQEIANTHVYEEKKQQSLKKLEDLDGKLSEADLLLEEKTKYIKELKSEKEAAEKYYETKNSLLFNNTLLLKSKITKNNLLKKKKEETLEQENKKLEDIQAQLNDLESQSSKIDEEISGYEKKIELESHNQFVDVSKKINTLEHEIRTNKEKSGELKKSVEELQEKKKEIKHNIDKNKQDIQQLTQKNEELKKQLKEKESSVNELNKQIDELKGQMTGNNMDELNSIDKKLEEIEEELVELNKTREDYNVKIERLNTKISHYEEEIKGLESTEEKNKDMFKDLESKREELKKLIMDISNLSNKDSEISARIGNLQKEHEELLDKYTKLKSKAEQAQHAIANNKAVEEVLRYRNKDDEVHGTVAELGSVDEKYTQALETAGGGSLYNIVVNNDDTAIKYINYLKQKKIGTATFLPLSKIKASVNLDDSVLGKEGVVDYAVNLIKFDKKYENIFKFIFRDTLVIEDIKYSKSLGISKYRMVTLDGDLVSKSGAMSGGFKSGKKAKGLFKDEKAIEDLDKTSEKLNTVKETLDHLKKEKEDIEKQLHEKRQKKIELEGEVVKLEKSLEVEGKDKDSLSKEIDLLKKDKNTLDKSFKSVEEDIKKNQDEKKKLQDKKQKIKDSFSKDNTVNQISELEGKRDKEREKYLELKSQVESNNMQLENVMNPETENLKKNLKSTEEYITSNNNKIKELREELKSKEAELKELKAKEKELSKGYKSLIQERDKKKQEKKKIDDQYDKVYKDYVSVKESIAKLQLQIEEYTNINKTLDEELESFYEEIKSFFENNEESINNFLDQIQNSLQEELDLKSLQNKVNALKAKLNSFGQVNLKALQIYEQLSNEYNELLKKRENLNKDKDEVLNLISELDQKRKEMFLDTYHKIRENFKKMFSKLSSKGEADLILEDENDIFNNGVMINVQLSKKTKLDIKALSGGEKSITAIAFIFAVQEFNPSNFYIFDEVDAALDNWNAEKLGQLIREYSRNSQYITVSHNENLIRSSDIIYGVTMNPNKTSDIVSLKFDEVDESMVEGSEEAAES